MVRTYCEDCGQTRNHTIKDKASEGKLKIIVTSTCTQGHIRTSKVTAYVTHSVEDIMVIFTKIQLEYDLHNREKFLQLLTEQMDKLIRFPHR